MIFRKGKWIERPAKPAPMPKPVKQPDAPDVARFKAVIRAAVARGKAKAQAVSHAQKQIAKWEKSIKLGQTKLATWKRKLRARERALRDYRDRTTEGERGSNETL